MGPASVDFLNSLGDECGVGDHLVRTVGGPCVPHANPMQDDSGQHAPQAAGIAAFAQVAVLHVPRISNGRVNVGDVDLIRAGQYPLGDRIAARDDKIVAGQVELLDRNRHQRQEEPMMILNKRHLLQEAGANRADSEPRAIGRRQEVEQRKYVSGRIAPQDLAQHALSAADGVKPVMNNGDAHCQGLLVLLHRFNPAPLFCFGG